MVQKFFSSRLYTCFLFFIFYAFFLCDLPEWVLDCLSGPRDPSPPPPLLDVVAELQMQQNSLRRKPALGGPCAFCGDRETRPNRGGGGRGGAEEGQRVDENGRRRKRREGRGRESETATAATPHSTRVHRGSKSPARRDGRTRRMNNKTTPTPTFVNVRQRTRPPPDGSDSPPDDARFNGFPSASVCWMTEPKPLPPPPPPLPDAT